METLILTIVGIIFAGLFGYLVKFAKEKIQNEALEKLLVDAIGYAEELASAIIKNKVKNIKYEGKMAVAKEYIDKIDPEVIKKYGDNIELLIERKLGQIEGVGASEEKAVK